MRILLVEDDAQLGEALSTGLKQFNMTVDWLMDGQSAKNAILTENFDMIILDLGLPKKDGSSVLNEIRQNKNTTPVLILSARNEIADKINHLKLGADCYMTKPFDLELLVARIHSILRRQSGRIKIEFTHGALELDPSGHRLTIDKVNIPISRREIAILTKLFECKGRVVTRDALAQAIYGWGDDVDSNAIEVHIHNIRKKCGDHLTIRTIRGVGYIIEPLQ